MLGSYNLNAPTGNAEGMNVFLARMRRTKDYRWCDMEIYLGSTTEHIHTLVAVAKSDKLAAVLSNLSPPFSINMTDFSAPIVTQIIDWMYFGQLSIDIDQLGEYLRVVSHLGLNTLQMHCNDVLVKMARNGRHIEATNYATNPEYKLSEPVMESVLVCLYDNYEKLTRNDVKKLSHHAICRLLSAGVRQTAKIALINIAINWFRVPENLILLNDVIGRLTVDGMAEDGLVKFRKSLIKAIRNDQTRMILSVSRKNGNITINMDEQPKSARSPGHVMHKAFPTNINSVLETQNEQVYTDAPVMITHWTRDAPVSQKERSLKDVEYSPSEVEDIRDLPDVFKSSSVASVRPTDNSRSTVQFPRNFTRSEMMELNAVPNLFNEKMKDKKSEATTMQSLLNQLRLHQRAQRVQLDLAAVRNLLKMEKNQLRSPVRSMQPRLMSKSTFLCLKDDNFWGNEENNENNGNESQFEGGEKSSSWESLDSIQAEKQELAANMDDRFDDDGWENANCKKEPRKQEKVEASNPFGAAGQFGGFSRTNAAAYYNNDDKNKQRGDSRPNPNFGSPRWKSSTNENRRSPAQNEPIAKKLNFPPFEGATSLGRDHTTPSKEFSWNGEPNLHMPRTTRDRDSSGSVASLSDKLSSPRGDKSPSDNMLDEKYASYYEYLCQGFTKMMNSDNINNIGCDNHGRDVCQALQSIYYHQFNTGSEVYSKKVFVGGLPVDIIENDLVNAFMQFGSLVVDWPNKNESRSYFPPKGYVFLIFDQESSVRMLVENCYSEDEKLFLYIQSSSYSEKLRVQIRPWRLADADYLVDVNMPVLLRQVVFVGGVPRPIRAVELAHMMDRLYGGVVCAGIDTDVDCKYPKGAGRVAFSSYKSYMQAISDRYAVLQHGDIEKRVEIKPYVLDDQLCEECSGEQNGGRHAPFFCPHLECLQYYCESCWTRMHGPQSREHHKPLVKEA